MDSCPYIHSILFWSKYYAFLKVHFNFQFFHIAFSWFSSTFQFKLQSSFPRHLKSRHLKIADQFHPDIPEILIKYPQCIKHYVKCFNYRNNQGEHDSSYHGVILNLRLMACFLCRIFLKNDVLLIYPIHIYYRLLYIRIKSNSYFVSKERILLAYEKFGSSKLLLGSDSPYGLQSLEKTIYLVDKLNISSYDKDNILENNMMHLLKIKEWKIPSFAFYTKLGILSSFLYYI